MITEKQAAWLSAIWLALLVIFALSRPAFAKKPKATPTPKATPVARASLVENAGASASGTPCMNTLMPMGAETEIAGGSATFASGPWTYTVMGQAIIANPQAYAIVATMRGDIGGGDAVNLGTLPLSGNAQLIVPFILIQNGLGANEETEFSVTAEFQPAPEDNTVQGLQGECLSVGYLPTEHN